MPSPLVTASIRDLRPGTPLPVRLEVASLKALGMTATDLATPREPVVIALELEWVSGGLLGRGRLEVTYDTTCSRCSEPTEVSVIGRVGEMFREPAHPEFEDGYVVRDDQIELDALVRDAIGLHTPLRALCRQECAGLCQTCGANLNTDPCGHESTRSVDPRWAALSSLVADRPATRATPESSKVST